MTPTRQQIYPLKNATQPLWREYIQVEIAPGVVLRRAEDTWTLLMGGQEFSFTLLPGETSAILTQIQQGGAPLSRILQSLETRDGSLSVGEQIGRLWNAEALVASIYNEGKHFATLHHCKGFPLVPIEIDLSGGMCISEDACVRYEADSLLLESVSGGNRVRMASNMAWLPLPAGRSIDCEAWANEWGLPVGVIAALARWLVCIGFLRLHAAGGAVVQQTLGWSFADRMLHARSRKGRHIGRYGGTFRLAGRVPNPPAVRETTGEIEIQLPAPDLAEIAQQDPPFTVVLEQRRSGREHGQTPLSLETLGEFLYRTCRVTRYKTFEGQEYALRPYPSGGSLHELEIYPLIHRCSGIDAGLYRYNGATHSLSSIAPNGALPAHLVDEARQSAGMRGMPQIVLLIAARFMRVNWKYESLAYSLILKNVGVLFQTMYLVATAMRLAGCALGGGPSDAFCRLANTGFWQESTVGEFILGSSAGN